MMELTIGGLKMWINNDGINNRWVKKGCIYERFV